MTTTDTPAPTASNERLAGKVAIVTGAAGDIGAEYARAVARSGASVVCADLDLDKATAVAEEINTVAGGAACAHRVDIADVDSGAACAQRAVDEFGGLDLLVNNAAIFGGMKLDFLITVDWDYYKKFMAVNLDGQLNMVRAVLPHMQARGGGSIVNQTSTAAYMYSNFYGLAKAGVNALTQQLATELGSSGIRINAIAPGPIDTEANRTSTPQSIVNDMVAKLPLARIGTPADLVGTLLLLLSDEASWVTGQIFNVDGGQVFRP
ncbi:SDR family oxidoreductase [Dietzia sp.]|uniref:SDR family oxidoreductase n=1 Tax=Dietzia sp. TaxID=1871616 RepID=UPI002FDAC6ED